MILGNDDWLGLPPAAEAVEIPEMMWHRQLAAGGLALGTVRASWGTFHGFGIRPGQPVDAYKDDFEPTDRSTLQNGLPGLNVTIVDPSELVATVREVIDPPYKIDDGMAHATLCTEEGRIDVVISAPTTLRDTPTVQATKLKEVFADTWSSTHDKTLQQRNGFTRLLTAIMTRTLEETVGDCFGDYLQEDKALQAVLRATCKDQRVSPKRLMNFYSQLVGFSIGTILIAPKDTD